MSVTMTYSEPDHTIMLVVHDPWNVNEMIGHYPKMDEVISSSPLKVHTILDMTHTSKPPAGLLSGRVGTPVISHPNSGELCIVGATSFLRSVVEVAVRLTRYNRAHFFESVEAAQDFLRGLKT